MWLLAKSYRRFRRSTVDTSNVGRGFCFDYVVNQKLERQLRLIYNAG
uniref:Uncharacterized protein n=1 Tax=Anguilla anguilla TaxID=7936 RepID=A0A0E9VDM6_ANGAN